MDNKQIILDYQQYISSLIEKEFYNEKFLRELAELFGYDLVRKGEANYSLEKKKENE